MDETNNQTTYDDIINNDIFDLMGAKNMPESKKNELYAKLMDIVRSRATTFIADKLGDEDMKTWEECKNPEQKSKFLTDKGIDVAMIMLQQALILKTELIELGKIASDKKE